MFTWQVVSKEHRSSQWYMVGGALILALVLWGIFMGMYALSVVALLLAGVAVFANNNTPDATEIAIDENGIMIWQSFYDWTQVSAYAMQHDDGRAILIRLYFRSANILFATRDIDLDPNIPAKEIDNFLSQILERREMKDVGFIEKIVRGW